MIVNGFLMMKPNKVELFLSKTPVSTQHAYVNRAISKGKMIRFLSKEAQDFKELLQKEVEKKYGKYIKENETIFGSTLLEATIYLNFQTKRKADWDNYHKLWCDSLEGMVYDNDTQIIKATVYKGYSKENPGITINITPFIKD